MIAEAQMIVANQSLLPELSEAASQYWQSSKHPENFRDIKKATVESFQGNKALWAGFAGLLALEAVELSPLNETILVHVAREHFLATQGEDIAGAAARVGAITLAFETTIGVGFALYLSKAKNAVQIIHDRYIETPKTKEVSESEVFSEAETTLSTEKESEQNPEVGFTKRSLKRASSASKLAGLALLTGGGGATIINNLSDEDATRNKSLKYAIKSGAFLAAYDTAIATGIMWGTKSNIPALKEACETLIDLLTPRVVFGTLSGLLGIKALKEQRRAYKKLKQEGRI